MRSDGQINLSSILDKCTRIGVLTQDIAAALARLVYGVDDNKMYREATSYAVNIIEIRTDHIRGGIFLTDATVALEDKEYDNENNERSGDCNKSMPNPRMFLEKTLCVQGVKVLWLLEVLDF